MGSQSTLANTLFRGHPKIAIFVFLGLSLLTVLVILFYPRKFHSEAKLMLRVGRENVTLDPTASTTGETISLVRTRESEVNSMIEVMASREVLQQVVEKVGKEAILRGTPAGTPKPPEFLSTLLKPLKEMVRSIDPISEEEEAIHKLESNLRFRAPTESNVVAIEYRTKSPQMAQEVVQSWVEIYLQEHIKQNRTQGSLPFFQEQKEVLTQQLQTSRTKLRDAKSAYKMVTVQGQQRLLENQLRAVRDRLLTAEADLASSSMRAESLRSVLTKQSDRVVTNEVTGMPNEARDGMRQQLFDLEMQVKQLQSKFSDEHPRIVAAKRQLEETRQIVENQSESHKEVTLGINPTHQLLSQEILLEQATEQSLQKRAKTLIAQRKQVLGEMVDLNHQEQILAQMEQDIIILEERYRTHSGKLEQARLDEVLQSHQITSVNVIQRASFEQHPVTPQKKLCALLGFLAAIAGGVGMPMLLEGLKRQESAQDELTPAFLNEREALQREEQRPSIATAVRPR